MAAGTTYRTNPGSGETYRTYVGAGGTEIILPLKVDVGGTGLTEALWTQETPADNLGRTTAMPPVGAFLYADDGSNRFRVRGDTTYGLDVDVLRLPGLPPKPRTTRYSPSSSTSPAMSIGDVLVDEVEITNAAQVANGGGLLHNLVLSSRNLTIISAQAWLYQVNPTAASANSAHDQTDAQNEDSYPLGVIDFNQWRTTASNMHSSGTYLGAPLGNLAYQCLDATNTTSLWAIIVTQTAVTPASTTDYKFYVTLTAGL